MCKFPKKSLLKTKAIGLIFVSTVAFSIPSQAATVSGAVSDAANSLFGGGGSSSPTGATLADVVKAINNVWTLIASSVSTGVTTAANLLYEANPSLPAAITANTAQPSAIEAAKANSNQLSQAQVRQALTQDQDWENTLSKIVASDSLLKTSSVASIETLRQARNPSAGDANMNFQSLFGPTSYENNLQVSRANNFIRYAGNLGIPMSEIRWSKLSDENKEKLDKSSVGKEYKVLMRSNAAAQSVALDNLYNMLSERTVVKGLGTKAGLTKPDASPLEVQEFIATRRTRDPEWYNNMTKASPTTIQRETLYVLAEMQQQLYQQHLDNQRILATLSISQLQTMQASRYFNREIIEEVKKIVGISPSTTPELESPVVPETTPTVDTSTTSSIVNTPTQSTTTETPAQ